MQTVPFNPHRPEKISITFRDEKDLSKRVLELLLPSHLSIPFHWWLKTRGMVKV